LRSVEFSTTRQSVREVQEDFPGGPTVLRVGGDHHQLHHQLHYPSSDPASNPGCDPTCDACCYASCYAIYDYNPSATSDPSCNPSCSR